MVFINDFTPDMAGIYTVAVNTTGCNTTRETTVEALECKVFISSANAAGEETYKLTRSATETDTFEPLTLSLSNYDGSNDFTAYRIEWYHDGDLMTGKIQLTLSTALIGEYTARITLKSNPNTFCETTVTLSGTPCLALGDAAQDCDVNYTVAPPNALSSGITLSAGDEFTAGDFMVTVTSIISGDRAGWNGEGYVSIKVGGIVDLKRLAVTFDAAVVNSCYELSAGSVKTAYDPTWSNILDVDAVASTIKNSIQELKILRSSLIDKIEINDCSQASINSINEDLNILSTFETDVISELNISETEKVELSTLATSISNSFSCEVQNMCGSANGRLANFEDNSCDFQKINDKLDELDALIEEAENKTFIKFSVEYPTPLESKTLNDQTISYGNFGSLGATNNNPTDENWQTGTVSNPLTPDSREARIEFAKEIANIAYPIPQLGRGETPSTYYLNQLSNNNRINNEVTSTNVCPAEITNAQLIQKMSFPFTLVGGVSKFWNLPENYPELIFNRFLENSREDYHTDAHVEKLIYDSEQGKKMIKGIVTYFHKVVKESGTQYEGKFIRDNREEHKVNLPSFITEGYGVLFSMMGGTQQVRVLVKELTIANNTLNAQLVVQLMDIFGADEGDWETKFSPRAEQFNWKLSVVDELLSNNAKQSLVAFYALQKQRGYNPFRVINTFKITLDNVSLDAKPN